MIPPDYQSVIRSFMSRRDYHVLSVLVTILHTIRDVRLETIAEALPLPIQFESRRKKCNASWTWGWWQDRTFG
jgi:hypothetical protein